MRRLQVRLLLVLAVLVLASAPVLAEHRSERDASLSVSLRDERPHTSEAVHQRVEDVTGPQGDHASGCVEARHARVPPVDPPAPMYGDA